jgi:hypothetical protein
MDKEDKIKRHITGGHKTFGAQCLFERPTKNQLLFTLETNAAHSPKRFIPPDRLVAILKHCATNL